MMTDKTTYKPDDPATDKARAAAILAACEGKPVRVVSTTWLRQTEARVARARRGRVVT